ACVVGSGAAGDVAFEDVTCRVGEGSGTGRQSQGAYPARRPSAAGDGIVRTEPVVLGRVAAAGDVGCGEAGDVAFEHVTCRVGEGSGTSRQSQGADQEGGHLASGDGIVGTEPVVGRWVAAPGDSLVSQPDDVGHEQVVVVYIGEVAHRTPSS